MTNLASIFKSRDITLLTKIHLVKAMVFPVVMYGCESWTVKKAECQRIDAFELWCWRRLLSLGLQGDPTSTFWRRSALEFLWKEWCWSWNSSTLATSCEELTHWRILWCWEGLGAGGEGDDPGWDGWMASLTQWTWVWANFRSWWWTGRPGVLQFMGSQIVGHDWVTELNWMLHKDFPVGSDSKVSVYNVVDAGLIPGLERSPGEGNGNPLQDYCLENPVDRGAW